MSEDEDELFQVLESVQDEETFLQFLLALRDDREASVAQEKVTPSSPYGPERFWDDRLKRLQKLLAKRSQE